MGSGKVGKHSTHFLPLSLISAQVLVGANPPVLSLERSVCLLLCLMSVCIQGAFGETFLTSLMEDSTGWGQSLMDPLHHEL